MDTAEEVCRFPASPFCICLYLLVLALLLDSSVISFVILSITTTSMSVFCHSHPQQLCLG